MARGAARMEGRSRRQGQAPGLQARPTSTGAWSTTRSTPPARAGSASPRSPRSATASSSSSATTRSAAMRRSRSSPTSRSRRHARRPRRRGGAGAEEDRWSATSCPSLPRPAALSSTRSRASPSTRDGNAFVITDNDGVDDHSGETQFLSLGKLDMPGCRWRGRACPRPRSRVCAPQGGGTPPSTTRWPGRFARGQRRRRGSTAPARPRGHALAGLRQASGEFAGVDQTRVSRKSLAGLGLCDGGKGEPQHEVGRVVVQKRDPVSSRPGLGAF